MTTKETPTHCNVNLCKYNALAPPENSQACIACLYLKKKNWRPGKR